MADDIDILDGNAIARVVAAKDNAGVHTMRQTPVSEDNANAMAIDSQGHIVAHMEPTEAHFAAALNDVALAATEGFVLIDLSDTTNFPHSKNDSLHIKWLNFDWETASANDNWSLKLAFITAIDGTEASYREVFRINHLARGDTQGHDFVSAQISPLVLKISETIGVDVTGDTVFNTATALDSPRGVATVAPGVGDFIVRFSHGQGTVDFNILVGYAGADSNGDEG